VRNVRVTPYNETNKKKNIISIDFFESINNLIQELSMESTVLGVYQIEVVREDNHDQEALKESVRSCFRDARNLCEDLHEVEVLEEVPIRVLGRIEVSEVAHADELLLEILEQIHDYISPASHFHSLQEMQSKGYFLEHIMEGPRLEHGYLDDAELAEMDIRKEFRVSDIVHIIMDIDGVEAVRDLSLKADHSSVTSSPSAKWVLRLGESMCGHLDEVFTILEGLEIVQNGQVYLIDGKAFIDRFRQRIKDQYDRKQIRVEADLVRAPISGRDRNVSAYQSIVDQFPELYGIGKAGLPAGSTPKRRAQAKQLKAYLSFFDQLLSDSFARLGKAVQLLDVADVEKGDVRFGQSLEGVLPGFEELIDADHYNEQLEQQGLILDREKRLLHHLLARFGEYFTDFDLSLFDQAESTHPQEFLRDYPELSYGRYQAADYGKDSPFNKVSMLEKRLVFLLGLAKEKPNQLASLDKSSKGAFYLVEHILLRPAKGKSNPLSGLPPFKGQPKDPYSLQLSFVFPDWLDRWSTEESHAWQFVLQTLRMQTPAHIKIYVHRLKQPEMKTFEKSYRQLYGD
jgi:hypothetical protein